MRLSAFGGGKVLPDVRIAGGVVIAAGAVVAKDIELFILWSEESLFDS